MGTVEGAADDSGWNIKPKGSTGRGVRRGQRPCSLVACVARGGGGRGVRLCLRGHGGWDSEPEAHWDLQRQGKSGSPDPLQALVSTSEPT